MIVFSCFDGISCGQLALEKANIPVEKYYASEINKHAIFVTQKHYPLTTQLGNIEEIKGKDLPQIDLLIGGSPCQGFSTAGNRLNFNDSRSKLFFEFVRLLDECKPKYFLLENVKMKPAWENIISSYLGVLPQEIDSGLVSKQTRKRFYWTNIPVLNHPSNKNLFFNKYLYTRPHGYLKADIKFFIKFPTLTTQAFSDYRVVTDFNLLSLEKNIKEATREITIEECEEFQNLPLGYTEGLSNNHRFEVVGNGWTIDIVTHIFRYINNNKVSIELPENNLF